MIKNVGKHVYGKNILQLANSHRDLTINLQKTENLPGSALGRRSWDPLVNLVSPACDHVSLAATNPTLSIAS